MMTYEQPAKRKSLILLVLSIAGLIAIIVLACLWPSCLGSVLPYAQPEQTLGIMSVFDGGGIEASASTKDDLEYLFKVFKPYQNPHPCSFAYLKGDGYCSGDMRVWHCRFRKVSTEEEKHHLDLIDTWPRDYDPPKKSIDCWGKSRGRDYIPCMIRECAIYTPDVEP